MVVLNSVKVNTIKKKKKPAMKKEVNNSHASEYTVCVSFHKPVFSGTIKLGGLLSINQLLLNHLKREYATPSR